jgi:hypothetical protein
MSKRRKRICGVECKNQKWAAMESEVIDKCFKLDTFLIEQVIKNSQSEILNEKYYTSQHSWHQFSNTTRHKQTEKYEHCKHWHQAKTRGKIQ